MAEEFIVVLDDPERVLIQLLGLRSQILITIRTQIRRFEMTMSVLEILSVLPPLLNGRRVVTPHQISLP